MALGRLRGSARRRLRAGPGLRRRTGKLRGFLSFVPWGRNGLSLDLMRRDPTADNGLVELMVSALAERAATFGVGRVSLNFAMFREAFERGAQIGAGPVARLWRQALLLASRNWQLESLYRSNAKYLPDLAAALHVLRVHLGPAPGRHRRGQRRGVPDQAVADDAAATRRRTRARRWNRAAPSTPPRSTALIPDRTGSVAEAMSTERTARAGAGTPGEARPASAPRASSPTR